MLLIGKLSLVSEANAKLTDEHNYHRENLFDIGIGTDVAESDWMGFGWKRNEREKDE